MIIAIFIFLFSSFSWADYEYTLLGQKDPSNELESVSDWGSFEKFMQSEQEKNKQKGISYIISGILATVGGTIGYQSSHDPLSRGVYALSQSLGVGALGYGVHFLWIGSDYSSFYAAVKKSSLNAAQRSEILHLFLQQEKEKKENENRLKILTHSLVAAVNLYSASREQDPQLKSFFSFLAGINALMAMNYSF